MTARQACQNRSPPPARVRTKGRAATHLHPLERARDGRARAEAETAPARHRDAQHERQAEQSAEGAPRVDTSLRPMLWHGRLGGREIEDNNKNCK